MQHQPPEQPGRQEGPRRRIRGRAGRPWWEHGLARELSRRAAKRARIQLLVLSPLLAGVLLVYGYRRQLFGPGWDTTVRIATAVALIFLGWQLARDIGRSLGPLLLRRLEPGTAGTVGFLIRLATMLTAVVVALRVAKLEPRTLALGGALSVVVVGLAAQQTLGNLFAGTVLVSARPFRVGERVRLQGGPLAGTVEGTVTSLGLLYTILASGEDAIMVPNSVVLNVAVVPLREPPGVDVRARLRPGVTPLDVQDVLQETVRTAMREPPSVELEEVDGDEVVVRISATPRYSSEGPQLASEVLEAIGALTARSA
ncbi:MAG: small conductance mechanosensitive channel [Solirubrobacteraceae bacterium]|jgi:small conductance mechanosensitive channel